MTNNYALIAGIMTLLIITGGTTYYVVSAGTKTSCASGWKQINETHYSCGTRTELCFRITNSSNTPSYWCERGKVVNVVDPVVVPTVITTQHIYKIAVCSSTSCIIRG